MGQTLQYYEGQKSLMNYFYQQQQKEEGGRTTTQP
jgi:hypothetical protein